MCGVKFFLSPCIIVSQCQTRVPPLCSFESSHTTRTQWILYYRSIWEHTHIYNNVFFNTLYWTVLVNGYYSWWKETIYTQGAIYHRVVDFKWYNKKEIWIKKKNWNLCIIVFDFTLFYLVFVNHLFFDSWNWALT